MSTPYQEQVPEQRKLIINLKPEVLAQQEFAKRKKQKKMAAKNGTINYVVPDSLYVMGLGSPDAKFNVKLRDILDTLTFSVYDYIIYNLDNEATSDTYKSKLRTGLSKIRDDFIANRADDK